MRYKDLIYSIMQDGVNELNERTRCYTKRLFAQTVSLRDVDNIFCPRKIYPHISAAEAVWMLGGSKSTAWLNKQTKIWEKFEDSPGIIETAYGHRWRVAFGRDQITQAIMLLKKDPSSRQALVMSWDPRTDGLMNQGKVKNVPCPFAFNLFISEGEGRVVVYQRSCDVMAGLPYDLMTYFILGQAIFNSVDKPFYGVDIMIGDAHVYEEHWGTAEKVLKTDNPDKGHCLNHYCDVQDLVSYGDKFVGFYKDIYADVNFKLANKLEVAL